jgi:hypothetical protein
MNNKRQERITNMQRPQQPRQQQQSPPLPQVESQAVRQWLQNNATAYMQNTAPGLITEAALSQAIRVRWFNVQISGINYTVGANIHYGGNSGGMWVMNENTRNADEYHPHATPQHNLNQVIENDLPTHVQNWDQQKGTHYRNQI